MGINANKLRHGNFTSSEIAALLSVAKDKVSFGAPALTLIEECNMERRLKRSISSDVDARPTSWGNVVEQFAFSLLGIEYKISSEETIVHPTIPYWVGSPDGNKFDGDKTAFDIKCPYTMKSFCQLVDSKNINEVRENHKEGEKYYWQLVSNAILTDSKWGELIVFCPYKSQLADIRELVNNWEGDQNKVAWMNWATDDTLPWIPDGGHYKNINIMRFEIPQSDKDLLTQRVIEAGKLLIKIETDVDNQL